MPQLGVLTCRVLQRNAVNRRLPRLPDGGNATGRTVRMCEDATAGEVEQVGRARAPPRLGRLQSGLSRGDDGQDRLAVSERREACLNGTHHRVVILPKLV